MSTHKDRMKEIGFWAIPTPGTPERNKLDNLISIKQGDAKFRKKAKEIFDKATALIQVQAVNGLGFPADKQIREYNLEYNGRVLSGSLSDMPGSFNVVEAFNQFIPQSATFRIRDEKDFLFSFDDFIDFVTSDLINTENTDFHSTLEDGKIYSFNSIDPQSQITISGENNEKYEFSSASLVRFGNEVSMILLAGQECDLEAESQKIRNSTEGEIPLFSHRAHLELDEELELRAEPLFENSTLWKTVVVIRFDNSSKTIDARYLFRDWGRMYCVFTDDLATYIQPNGDFLDKRLEAVYESAKNSMDTHSALFELCKTCLLLPAYAQYFDADIVVERHPTNLLEFRKKVSNRKVTSLVPAKYLIGHREAFRISSRNQRSSTSSAFLAPEYQIETSGYWKQLGPRDIGHDKKGEIIHGRTWVSQTLSWLQETNKNETLVVSRKKTIIDSEHSGFIYVMRSAAHAKDIFKIGLTRRTSDTRSAELSRNTSSPDHFLVVQEWEVSDCVVIEREIHQRLAKYRINPNREFFRAPYNVIYSAIEVTLSELESNP